MRGKASANPCAELGHIRHRLLVRGFRFELAFQQVRGNNALRALVGTGSCFGPCRSAAGGTHQLQHGLVGDRPPLLEHFDMDSAMPFLTVVFLKDRSDGGLQGRPTIGAIRPGLAVEERGPGQTGNVLKNFQTSALRDEEQRVPLALLL